MGLADSFKKVRVNQPKSALRRLIYLVTFFILFMLNMIPIVFFVLTAMMLLRTCIIAEVFPSYKEADFVVTGYSHSAKHGKVVDDYYVDGTVDGNPELLVVTDKEGLAQYKKGSTVHVFYNRYMPEFNWFGSGMRVFIHHSNFLLRNLKAVWGFFVYSVFSACVTLLPTLLFVKYLFMRKDLVLIKE